MIEMSVKETAGEKGIVEEVEPSLVREGLKALLILDELREFLGRKREHYAAASDWMPQEYGERYRGRIEAIDEAKEEIILEEGRFSEMFRRDQEKAVKQLQELETRPGMSEGPLEIEAVTDA